MGINVSTTKGFLNYQFLQGSKNELLQKGETETKKIDEVVSKVAVQSYEPGYDYNFSPANTAVQIALDNSLKDTLKYLQLHSHDRQKQYILGELWKQFKSGEENNVELIEFEIDTTLRNIFAA